VQSASGITSQSGGQLCMQRVIIIIIIIIIVSSQILTSKQIWLPTPAALLTAV
jgi:hypothetical protein